jgi:hypothetical protein
MGVKQLFFVRTISITPEYVKPSGRDVFKPVYGISLHPEGAALFDEKNSQAVQEEMQERYPLKKFERIDAMAFMQTTQQRNQN